MSADTTTIKLVERTSTGTVQETVELKLEVEHMTLRIKVTDPVFHESERMTVVFDAGSKSMSVTTDYMDPEEKKVSKGWFASYLGF